MNEQTKIICYAHGEADVTAGPATIAICVIDAEGEVVHESTQSIGNSTADLAAYQAVLAGLQQLVELYGVDTKAMYFEMRLDNELVAAHVSNQQPVINPGHVPMFVAVHNLCVEHFPQITFSYVTPEQNRAVKNLARSSLD